MIPRRRMLGLPLLGLAACARRDGADVRRMPFEGGWVGAQAERGHAWRDGSLRPAQAAGAPRRIGVAVVGAGVAGLAAARGLRLAGVEDFVVFDLEDDAGGNARGHSLAGQACPLGAHYLPVPPANNEPLVAWLHEIGLARTQAGRVVYDDRHLCHSPQERLFDAGAWHEGLLPQQPPDPRTLEQTKRLSRELAGLGRALGFAVPTHGVAWTSGHAALDAQTFSKWLKARGYDAPALLWYLDYCCRDDYGAGAAQVSAWAGIQYFASRHGLQAPRAVAGTSAGMSTDDEHAADAVLTWPEGNARLTRALQQGLGERLRTGSVVTHVEAERHAVTLSVWDARAQRVQNWMAAQVVMAVPLFIAQRLLRTPPSALAALAPQLRYAPWLVSNLQLSAPLLPRMGAAPAWDNVLRASPALGYVDAGHQSLRPDAAEAGPFVLTHYWALGGDSAMQLQAQRQRLLSGSWREWADAVVADLAQAHPDLPGKLLRADLMRYGHAMCIPLPGVRGHSALQALMSPQGRLHFAHADLSAYSVFEEAFSHGLRAGQSAARLTQA